MIACLGMLASAWVGTAEMGTLSVTLDAAPYRVRSVTFDYARRPRGRYSMRLGLGAV